MKRLQGWWFCGDDRRIIENATTPEHRCLLVKPGQTLHVEGPLEMCENGLHASKRPLDALSYAPSSTICRAELWGQILRDKDKICAEYRKILWMADAENTLHEFACECAVRALESCGKTPDPRSLHAIDAKLGWLAGVVTSQDLVKAGADAWKVGAVFTAVCAAAFCGTARYAARYATKYVAKYAATAFRAAEVKAQNIRLTEMLEGLK